jgi:hypothetical protein
MRNHVGVHVLKAFRQVNDPLLDGKNMEVRKLLITSFSESTLIIYYWVGWTRPMWMVWS